MFNWTARKGVKIEQIRKIIWSNNSWDYSKVNDRQQTRDLGNTENTN